MNLLNCRGSSLLILACLIPFVFSRFTFDIYVQPSSKPCGTKPKPKPVEKAFELKGDSECHNIKYRHSYTTFNFRWNNHIFHFKDMRSNPREAYGDCSVEMFAGQDCSGKVAWAIEHVTSGKKYKRCYGQVPHIGSARMTCKSDHH